MMKYITLLLITFLIIGCGTKATSVKADNPKKSTITKESNSTAKAPVKAKKELKRITLPEGFKEIKKLRPLDANVPATCQEWSDGCNTCTRAGNNQASCTIYTCENKTPFSCLKWQ